MFADTQSAVTALLSFVVLVINYAVMTRHG